MERVSQRRQKEFQSLSTIELHLLVLADYQDRELSVHELRFILDVAATRISEGDEVAHELFEYTSAFVD